MLDIEIYQKIQKSPIFFAELMWGLTPQPLKPEWAALADTMDDDEFRADMFEPFQKGKHLTWQQWLFLRCVERAVAGEGKRRISVKSGHGCHAYDTGILMFDGTIKKVQDIVEGDILMGDDSTPRVVLGLSRGTEKMYRIKYFDGSYYDVNASHILSLVSSQTHGKQKTGQITNVSVKDYLGWSDRKKRTNIGYRASVGFKEKVLPIEPYLFGLWLGDGTSANGNITNIDKEIVDYLKTWGAKGKGITYKIPGLSLSLKGLGVLNNKHIPHGYLTGSREQRLELLAGLLDTDGYLDVSSFQIIQKNKAVADGIVFLARSLGMHATLNQVQKTCTNSSRGRVTGTYWNVNISRNIWNIPTRVERKKAKKPTKPQRENLHFGFEVIPLDEQEYYGFEASGNNLYLLEDFTVTHNTGKSATLSIIILWFLFSFKDAQVPATAPTSDQIHDVLWKELAAWIYRMPKEIAAAYEWSTDYIRMVESPQTWFARAKTARKESPEALAGVHGEHVMYIADEASGIPEEIFNTAEGALTNKSAYFIMTSNPTRLVGYFFNSHKEDSENWQTLTFSSEDSPIVDEAYTKRIEERHGRDSDEFSIRVYGQFPREDSVDDKGYIPLFSESDLKFTDDDRFMGTTYMGVDPAGEGDDTTSWVVRDNFKAAIVATEKISTEKSIAIKTIDLAKKYKVNPSNIFVDNFGVGANVSREILAADSAFYVSPVNVGKESDDDTKYLNKRAEAYYAIKQWLRNGGLLLKDNRWKQLLNIRYRREEKDKMKIMSKREMRKDGIKSPNEADALMLTFAQGREPEERREAKQFKKKLGNY